MKLQKGLGELLIVLATPHDGSANHLTPILWSAPGEGKSALLRSLFADSRIEVVSAALHEPQDFGGFPVPDPSRGYVRYLPPHWAVYDENEEGCIFLDDAPLASPATFPALMKLALERTIGSGFRIGAQVKVVLAGNPGEGIELADPLANRLVHIDYHLDLDLFIESLNESRFPEIAIPKLNASIHQQVTQLYRVQFAAFLQRFPQYVSSKRSLSDSYPNSFATKRSIDMALRLCATAHMMQLAPLSQIHGLDEHANDVILRLMQGILGTEVAVPWTRFMSLPNEIGNPRKILSGEASVDYQSLTDDLIHAFFCSMSMELTRLQSQSTKDFFQASILFCDQIAQLGKKLDCAYAPIRSLVREGWFGRASQAAAKLEASDDWERAYRQAFHNDSRFCQLGKLVEEGVIRAT
ncbi:hypothetical protein SH501x_003225 [Pirellulaceae bacterium SH501]